ncbi:siderophore ferric iron reductase [Grimontia kaedaensis]|uniref:Siderophore ferric iron reductase n=1 Tax=Grimontia kaedaensis TaxID=2872157 RepID=A0ABY4WXC9_9GAMM|nr:MULTISPECIES: siderophore ferric iron reductase [Grimontia]USH03645.1 siderophore ferric iron reductase [Grimontia kaedaensis]WRV97930.1 siderophore ferric iron reductase [Grimontia sp. NTOU-MAR1]
MFPDWLKLFWFRPQSPAIYQLIFTHSKQVSPYLKGSFGDLPQSCISIENPTSSASIREVYREIEGSNPEAGGSYWLTRTWDLLCWQPIYLSFLSIYGLKSLPDFTQFGQFKRNRLVAGYRFASEEHWHGEPEELIPLAAEQLSELFEQYRAQINDWARIRPGFTNHLLADLILSCLIKLQTLRPELESDYIEEQAALWLDAFKLPKKHLISLSRDEATGKLRHMRISCCLVYKCKKGSLCSDCPRRNTRQALTRVKES